MAINIKKDDKPSRSALRRQREKELRYKTILKAAETLISKKGYHQASMEEIADLAEVSVGTVYFYFKNKDDLLINLIKEIGFLLRKFLGDKFLEAAIPLDGFKTAGLGFFEEFCVSHKDKVSILFLEAVGQSAEVEAVRKEHFDKLTKDIIGALKIVIKGSKTPSKYTLEVIAVCIGGIYDRVALHFLQWQDCSKDISEIGQEAVTFILQGVNNLISPGAE